jgi:phage terminase large subunit GpA-like protein
MDAVSDRVTHPGALRLLTESLSKAIRPQRPLSFDQWLPKNIVLVDGPKKGEFWSASDAPYLVEIAECLSQENPCTQVTVRKCQQSGASILALAWTLYIAELCPDNVLYAVPGIDALQDINAQKLQPLIDAWQRETGKRIILPAVSRSGSGSTVYEKRYAGGAISLANANSVMDLSMKTSRYGVKDEVSKWQDTPNGDDPETLFFGRFTAFRRQRSYKILEISTPENDLGDELGDTPGHCRIDRSFRRSDQRYWTIACPECDGDFVQSMAGFIIDRQQPHRSEYGCPHCGHLISETERVAAVRCGRYVATVSGPDCHPGFHVDAFMSLMMSYGDIASDFLEQEGRGEAGQKNFSNLVLALPYAMRGNAPDWQRLMERRDSTAQGFIPAEGLILTAGADVQHSGIYIEVVAFGEDRQSWSVLARFLPGATDDPNAGAWTALADIWKTPLDYCGVERRIEEMGVDAGDGGRTTQVYEWCARHHGTKAIKGVHGRGIPAIGLPTKKSVTRRGRRRKNGGALSWPVGTWGLKAELYGNLHKQGRASGEADDPPGYCHFTKDHDEEFFRQLTAEAFVQKMVNGKLREEWVPTRRDNHFLDCRIYAMAMAELLNLSKMTREGWSRLRAKLMPLPPADLFSTAVPPAEPPVEAGPMALAGKATEDEKKLRSARKGWQAYRR